MSDISLEEAPVTPGALGDVPSSEPGFEAFPISVEIRSALAEMGFTRPTPVQVAAIGPVMAGSDLVVQSKTGSGKTCAFGIPMLEKLPVGETIPQSPRGLVLVPTRELAHQVATELRHVSGKKALKIHAIYGGVPMGRQIAALKSGSDVVVSTPGRLLDHLRRGNINLNHVQMVVLDEADEMLSMGFWDDVTDILKKAPESKQCMLFSATLPYQVAKAAAQFLREPVRVDLSGDDLTVKGINNCIFNVLPDLPKPRQLLYLLETEQPKSAIIFCNTRNETEMIAKFLTQYGFVAEAITGNFKQRDRERVMGRIKDEQLRFMVATDVAARGIDISHLTHVFNYSLPEFSEVYLHRVGRTGRVGRDGVAISLVDGKGLGTLSQLEREFGISFTERFLPREEDVLRARSERIMKELSDKASVSEVAQHVGVAQEILQAPDASQVVAFLLKSYFTAQANVVVPQAPAAHEHGEHGGRRGGRHHGPQQGGQPRHAQHAPRAPQAEGAAQEGDGDGEARVDGEAGEGAEAGRRRRRRRRNRRGSGRPTHDGAIPTMGVAEALASGGSNGGGQHHRRHADHGHAPSHRGAPHHAHARDVPEGHAAHQPLPVAAGQDHANDSGAAQSSDGLARIWVNIGFDDGFKGRGAVAKKISALAGLTDGSVTEVESRRDHAVLKAAPNIAELVVERVDGCTIGKKIVSVSLAS